MGAASSALNCGSKKKDKKKKSDKDQNSNQVRYSCLNYILFSN